MISTRKTLSWINIANDVENSFVELRDMMKDHSISKSVWNEEISLTKTQRSQVIGKDKYCNHPLTIKKHLTLLNSI